MLYCLSAGTTIHLLGPTESNVTLQVNSIEPLLIIGVTIVATFMLVLLVIIAAAAVGCPIKWLVFNTYTPECMFTPR